MLTKEKREALRRLATTARETTGSGGWSQEEVGSCVMGVAAIDDDGNIGDAVAECVEFDAAVFIASADPDTVIVLLDAADQRDALLLILRDVAADYRERAETAQSAGRSGTGFQRMLDKVSAAIAAVEAPPS